MATTITIFSVLLIIMAIFLVVAVLMQSGKDSRLSGTIAGGAETFFGKTKGKTIDRVLSKATTIVAIVFVILVFAVYVMQGIENDKNITVSGDSTTDIVETAEDEHDHEHETEEATTSEEVATEDAAGENTENAEAGEESAENTDAGEQPAENE